jgi:hypothetical protein
MAGRGKLSFGRAKALEACPLGDKTMRRSQNGGINDAQTQLIHPETRVSHRDDVYIFLGIEARGTEDN